MRMSLERALNALDGEPIAVHRRRCPAAESRAAATPSVAPPTFGPPRGLAHLRAQDPVLAELIAAVGKLPDARKDGPTARTTTARWCARSSASSCR